MSLEPTRSKISTENAIPEFKQMLSRATNIEAIQDAVQQMAPIIESQITHSLADTNYDRVVEALGTIREELVDYEEPTMYNDFIIPLKEKMLAEKLGGDRKELWWRIRKSKLGLIEQKEVESSTVEEDEAREVGIAHRVVSQITDDVIVSCCKLKWLNSITCRIEKLLKRKMIIINPALHLKDNCQVS